MRDYIAHKTMSIAAPLLVATLILLIGMPEHETWRTLFIIIIIYAYTHFSIGAFFQLRGYARSENALPKFALFLLLCLLALAVSWLFIVSPLFIIVGMFGVGYFMVHGFLNEATLFNRQAGALMPLSTLAAVIVWLTSVAFLGLGHPSALVGPGLNFLDPPVASFFLTYSDYAHAYTIVEKIAWIGIAAAFVFLIMGTVTHRQYRVSFGIASVMVPLTYWIAQTGPPSYILVYFMLLGYHFTSWLIFYGERYRTRTYEWRFFIGLHSALILIFLIPLLPLFSETSLMENFYNVNTLFMFSLIHITTSFMNEEWFKNNVMPHLWKT